ncbi:MAG TPA: hypothetical protein VNK24_09430 [Elusimicrobiota bacterium]|nr:hypothetical protein [Elusimicrobiota bacterium]
MPKKLSPFALILAAALAAPAMGAAQPVEVSPGQNIIVVMGSGTSIPAGTELNAQVVYENAEGLRFSTPDRGMFFVKWDHIRRIGLQSAAQPAAPSAASNVSQTQGVGSSIVSNAASPLPTRGLSMSGTYSNAPNYGDHGWNKSGDQSEFSNPDEENTDPNSGRWRLFLGFDYLGTGNTAKNTRDGLGPVCNASLAYDQAHGGTATSCSDSATVFGAEGFRIGAFRDYSRSVDWGASIGYLNGGPQGVGSGSISLNDNAGANLAAHDSTVRLLGEARKTWNLHYDGLALRLGAGLGIAVDNQTIDCSPTGQAVAGACGDAGSPSETSYGWLTWELSPALVYKDFSLGLRYVGFGRSKFTPWNTFGGFLGLDFR